MERLNKQIQFINELEKLKIVNRTLKPSENVFNFDSLPSGLSWKSIGISFIKKLLWRENIINFFIMHLLLIRKYLPHFTYKEFILSGSAVSQWMEVSKEKVQQVDSRTVTVDLSDFGNVLGGSISYIWRESPVKALYMLPIYSDDQFRMPTPPFKFDLA